ncbi:MAG: formate dehydrogenase accessory sulfurtransferase FdhD [Syntrophomonadaceae bacterium]|jgi:FdhD protein
MTSDAIKRQIFRYQESAGIQDVEDLLVNEEEFAIYVNDRFYGQYTCSPSYWEEMVVGKLALEGTISTYEDIISMDNIDNQLHVKTNGRLSARTSALVEEPVISALDVIQLMKKHLESSELHRFTGGVHLMGLGKGNSLLAVREDISRHTAVEKIYGYCLINNVECRDKIFLSSGRVTKDLIAKILEMQVRIIVSRAAVSSRAQEMAQEQGITLIGFARGERFNIYSHPHRIIV